MFHKHLSLLIGILKQQIPCRTILSKGHRLIIRGTPVIRMLFLIPLGLCLIWTAYLKMRGYTLGQGKQGYMYILIFSAVIAAFYTVVMWLTRMQ